MMFDPTENVTLRKNEFLGNSWRKRRFLGKTRNFTPKKRTPLKADPPEGSSETCVAIVAANGAAVKG